jgi:hypothetical protein
VRALAELAYLCLIAAIVLPVAAFLDWQER